MGRRLGSDPPAGYVALMRRSPFAQISLIWFASMVVLAACAGEAGNGSADQADASKVVPDLVGQPLSSFEAEVVDLRDAAGTFAIHNIPSDDAAMGVVLSQSPDPGEPALGARVVIEVSEGGPVSTVGVLPAQIFEVFERSGIAPDTPVRVLDTDDGTLYKSDDLLVAESCAQLSQAHWNFVDSSYGRACPGS